MKNKTLSPPNLEAFTPWQCKKDEVIIQQGQPTQSVKFLKSGLVRLYFVDADGNEQTKFFLTPGYFAVPIHSLFQNVDSWFSIQASNACTGFSIPSDKFKDLLRSNLQWANYWSDYMVRLFIEKENRERDLLALDASERYAQFKASAPEALLHAPLHQIASYLGMTDVTLSRIRRKNANRGSQK